MYKCVMGARLLFSATNSCMVYTNTEFIGISMYSPNKGLFLLCNILAFFFIDYWKRKRLRLINKPHFFIVFFFFSISSLFFSTVTSSRINLCPDSKSCSLSAKAGDTYFQFQESSTSSEDEGMKERWKMGGIGSAPPRCAWKCGSCTPCKPVHVPVPPGNPVTTEYYPEAWRCKCGNKLYMP